MTTNRLVFHCPDIKNQGDADIIRELLQGVAGVGEVDVNSQTKQVTVITSSQDGGRAVLEVMLASAYPPVDER